MQQASKFGIYLNAKENQVVRINSPYWIPPEPDWVLLTPEVKRHPATDQGVVQGTERRDRCRLDQVGDHTASGLGDVGRFPAVNVPSPPGKRA